MQIRILILTHNYIRFPGDFAGIFLHDLSRGLVAEGHKVFVLAPHQKDILRFQKLEGVEIRRFRYAADRYERIAYAGNMHELVTKNPFNFIIFFFFLLSFLYNSYKLAKSKRIDLILSQWWIPGGLIGFLGSIFYKKPLVLTLHGTDIRLLLKSKLFQSLAYPIFKRARYITTVSGFLKSKVLSILPLPEEKFMVVPMPVNPDRFCVLNREKEKPIKSFRPAGKKIILSVARFTEQKGVRYLLEALKWLKEKGYDFEAKIVGEGPLEKEFKRKLEESSLSSSIHLIPMMTPGKLKTYYQECDIFVLPSVEEGFGLVLVEAQFCKKPVVGIRSGGITDIIEDGKTGLLALPRDFLSLALALERILTDDIYAEELAEAGYRSAEEKFSPEAIRRKYIEVLKNTVKRSLT